MADKKISDLVDGGLPDDADEFVVARGTTNNKLAWSSLSAIAASNQIAASADGNTTGALALVSSGTLILAGGNNITLSQAGNAITISGVSIPAESQTFIGAIVASNTTYTSGSVVLTGSGAATVKSGTGQQVIIDVPVQSVQPETQTFVAGISASDTLYTSGNVRLTGVGGGVTVGTNTGQRIDISVAAPVAQTAQTGISGIANSQTTYTSGTVSLSELGAITIRSTTGNQYQFSVNAQSVQPETKTFLGGIQNSQTTYTSGTVNLSVNGGNLTIRSTTGNAFQFSMSQTVQPETQTAISGIANSQTTYTSGTVSLSELGAITIRSTTGNQYQFSVAAQTGTYQSAIAASNTTYTSGLVVFTGSNMVTVKSSAAGQTVVIDATQTNQSAIKALGASNTGNTSGNTGVSTGIDWVLAGTNNITISQSTAGGGPNTLWVSGPTVAGAQTGISGIGNSQTTYTSGTVNLSVVAGNLTIRSTTGNAFQFSASQTVQAETQTFLGALAASNTTYTSGTVTITGVGGGVTVSSNTGQRIDISVAAQTTQTQGILSAGVSTGGNTSGNTTVNTGSRMVFVGSNNITLSQGTAAGAMTITISGPATSAQQTGISGIANSQTTYTSGTVSLSELGAITIRSTTGNQYQFSVNSQTVQTQSFLSAGMSTNGNTSGDTAFVTGRLALMGGNNITLSGSTNGGSMSITVSAPNLGAGAMSAGVSTGGNTAGATGITGTQLVLVGSGPISLSQTTGANGGTVSINAPATSSLSATGIVRISTNGSTISVGVAEKTAAAWENMPIMDAVLYTHLSGVSKTPFYWYENLAAGINPASIAFRVSMVTANSDLSLSAHFGIYTFVNSTSAALLGSASDAFHVSSASSVSLSGQRQLVMTSPGTVTAISSLTPGNYVFGMMFSATATNAMNASIYAASAAAGPRLGRIMPGTNQLSTATSQGVAGMYGRGSVTVNVMPANIVASDVVNQGIGASSPMKPYIFIRS